MRCVSRGPVAVRLAGDSDHEDVVAGKPDCYGKKPESIKISVTTPPYSLLIPGELGADSVIYQGRSLRQGVALFFSGGDHLFLRYMISSY
jgi:hypothetical protein